MMSIRMRQLINETYLLMEKNTLSHFGKSINNNDDDDDVDDDDDDDDYYY